MYKVTQQYGGYTLKTTVNFVYTLIIVELQRLGLSVYYLCFYFNTRSDVTYYFTKKNTFKFLYIYILFFFFSPFVVFGTDQSVLPPISKETEEFDTYTKNTLNLDDSEQYTLKEVTAAYKLSDWIWSQQDKYGKKWVYDILFWLEVFQQKLDKEYHYDSIELTQDIVRDMMEEKRSIASKGEDKVDNVLVRGETGVGGEMIVPFIDHQRVQETRLGWVNTLRVGRNLPMYRYSTLLENTSYTWSQDLADKGVADHKRHKNSGYYDYAVIEDWFGEEGIGFKNRKRATFTENIGRASYNCDNDDCTDVAISSMKKIFNYFVSEESYNGVHWRTMMQPNFTHVGVGFTISDSDSNLYGVMHYGVEPYEI